jgi:hypothetical protein
MRPMSPPSWIVVAVAVDRGGDACGVPAAPDRAGDLQRSIWRVFGWTWLIPLHRRRVVHHGRTFGRSSPIASNGTGFSDTTARSVRERVVASVEALLGVARDLEGMASAIER